MLSALGFHFRHAISSLAGCVVASCSLLAAAQPAGQPPAQPNAAQPSAQPVTPASSQLDANAEAATVPSPPPAVATSEEEDGLAVETERRGGFVLGLIMGPALGWATGNPSDKGKRDDPAYEQDTGLAFGYRVTPFLGGALTDWFTFGLGMSFGTLGNGDYSSGMGTFVFHLEAFPLYGQGGVYRDLGLTADFGAGASSIRTKSPDEKVAESGVMSSVGLGAFWEPVQVWQLAGGPYVGYQHNWSRWYSRHDVTFGLRVMFYGVQP